MKRIDEIRELLSEYADIDQLLRQRRQSIVSTDNWFDAYRIAAHVEQRYAEEIALLFDKNPNERRAFPCDTCGSWSIDEYCQCVTEGCTPMEAVERLQKETRS